MIESESGKALKLTSHADLLKEEANGLGAATVAADFGKAFVQSAAIDPIWNGAGQLVSAGKLPHVSIINETHAQKSEASAWAQKFGSAIGIAADFVILSKGKRALFGPGASAEAIAAMPFHERALKSAWDGTKLGAFYGAVLTPSDPKENLLWGRVANAGSQALTFGLMNYGAEFLGSAKLLKDIKPGTSAQVWKDMSVAGLAGMPAGAAGVVADAALRGKELKLSNVGNAAFDYGVIGFAMAGLTHGAGALSRPDANGVTTARHMTDKIGITSAPEFAGKQSDFRIVGGKTDFDAFYRTRSSSAQPAEVVVNVQQKLHGAFSGLFGERFASYGDTRPMLLNHGNELKALPGIANSFGLVATCEPLAPQFRANDVFAGRSTAADKTVWLQPRGENAFRLSLGEKPIARELAAHEAVPLGLPRLEHIDARTIKVGETLDANAHITLTRDAEGKLWVESKTGSQGIWTQVPIGREAKVQATDHIYSGDKLIDPAKLQAVAAQITPGAPMHLADHLFISKRADGELYIKAPASHERFYLKSETAAPVEVSPYARFIHLGPEGIVPITNELVVVPRKPPEPKPIEPGTGENPGTTPPVAEKPLQAVDPLVPAAPVAKIDLVEQLNPGPPPPPPREKPVVEAKLIENLGDLASRLTGQAVDPKDPAWRWGKFGEVVLDPAMGGVAAPDNTIRIVFADHDAALAAGRFTTGIFKRRLQTDPKDKMTAPSMKVTVDEFQTEGGTALFTPVIDIRGIGAGRLVLGDNLRPLGVQNSQNLIEIDQKGRRP